MNDFLTTHIRRFSPLSAISMTALLALAACATGPVQVTPASPTSNAACAATSASMDYTGGAPVRRLRIYTNPATGDSAIEDTPQPPKHTALMKTGKILYEYDFGVASKTQIVAGPANLMLPLHPAPYREAFLVLQGSVLLELGDGTRRELKPGDMTIFEDTDARIGHGGMTGPCGYVSLDIRP